jgi:hypothetical protein
VSSLLLTCVRSLVIVLIMNIFPTESTV